MNLSNISIHSLSEALAWTIFHSIWQAALIAGLLALAFRIINKNNAQLRYTMASLSMLLIFVLASFTFILSLPAETIHLNLSVSGLNSNTITDASKPVFSWALLKSFLPTQILFPILLRTWMIGICLLSLRMVINYTTALRLKKHKAFPLNKEHMILASNVLGSFKIRKKILFKESASIDSPSLIGYFKPVILLPISLMSGIPDNQLEIIIAHELAHISRHDYLVQFIQGIIEILFFYHPLVWWLSSVVNTEREHICDDLAVKVCGESITLIKALNNMESIRRKKPELVLNFSGKKANLLHRVRRILNPVTVKHPKLERGLMSVLFVFALSGMVLFSNLANSENKVQLEPVNVKHLSFEGLDNEEIQNSKIIQPLKARPVKLNQTDSLKLKKEDEKLDTVKMLIQSDSNEIVHVVAPKVRLTYDSIRTPLYILNGAELSKETFSKLDQDELKSVFILKDTESKLKYGKKGENGVILITTKEKSKNKLTVKAPLCLLDGVEISQLVLDKLDPDYIESIKVLKDPEMLSYYGKKGRNGVILLKTKKMAAPTKYSNSTIKIKGKTNNPPLYILDGVEISKQALDKLDTSEIESMTVLKDATSISIYGVKGKNGVILITSKGNLDKKKESKKKRAVKIKGKTKNPPLYILNGVEISSKVMDKLDPDGIESVKVLKDATALDKYGEKGENGVILITSKGNLDKKKKSKNKTAINFKEKKKNPPLYIVDGIEHATVHSMKDIAPDDVELLNILTKDEAKQKYGKKAKHGVIEITTKGNKKAPSFNEYMKKQ